MSLPQRGSAASQRWTYAPIPEMADEEFHAWRLLLEQRTGMQLTVERKTFLRTNLASRMRELGLDCYRDYYRMVMDRKAGGLEWIRLVDRLTVHETRFFRNPEAYSAVRRYLAEVSGPFTVQRGCDCWSVGCSTGEEPYSLAMLLDDELSRNSPQAHYSVTGSDISLPVLARAREGAYQQRRLQDVEPSYRERYFEGVAADYQQIKMDLRRRVCFAQVNVLELRGAPIRDMQIIFCHNMLIYFRRWLRQQILDQLADCLRPGGLLVIGLGEAPDWKHPALRSWRASGVQAWIRQEAV